jgi:hypothetical protein
MVKVGTKLKCIDDSFTFLTKDRIYTVLEVSPDGQAVCVDGKVMIHFYKLYRFEIVGGIEAKAFFD